ncbi:MAG: hypothetical protein Q7U36_03760 [bacterium]|nr:hypothetical protein [bacterium]
MFPINHYLLSYKEGTYIDIINNTFKNEIPLGYSKVFIKKVIFTASKVEYVVVFTDNKVAVLSYRDARTMHKAWKEAQDDKERKIKEKIRRKCLIDRYK